VIIHRCCPAPLMDIVTFYNSDTAVRRLRSSTTRAAVVKRTRTQFGRRAFSVAGPDIWNSLPSEVRLTENFATFKKKFNICLTWLFLILAFFEFYLISFLGYFVFKLHRMHEMQPNLTDVRGVCLSVCLSVCHAAHLGFPVQKWLNRSKCCLG